MWRSEPPVRLSPASQRTPGCIRYVQTCEPRARVQVFYLLFSCQLAPRTLATKSPLLRLNKNAMISTAGINRRQSSLKNATLIHFLVTSGNPLTISSFGRIYFASMNRPKYSCSKFEGSRYVWSTFLFLFKKKKVISAILSFHRT